MELRQLKRFLAVYDHGSLADAARHLGLTQQALSASLANLEEEIGLRLFDRSPGGVTRATEFGHSLVPHARSQLAADQRAVEELRSLGEGKSGTVTVGVGEAFAGDVIVTAVLALQDRRPSVRINLIEGYSEQLRHRLYDGEFDFIAAGVSAFELERDYEREQIYSSDDVLVCRSDHPLANKRQLKLADLEGYPWLVPYSRPSDLNTIVDSFVAENLEPPSRIIGSDAYRIGMRLLRSSDLVMMVAPALVAPELEMQPAPLARLRIDLPTIRRQASLIYPRHRPLTPPARLLLDEVRKHAHEGTIKQRSASA
ncbi:MAG: LysR family transcriptional regulator [Gammaproteobacteria bacterium]|nr:LysR family transcriptional regulator [Gammaproteobacteria bacterium]